MKEPIWLPRLTKLAEVYSLIDEDDPEATLPDIVLVLESQNGDQFRLPLDAQVASRLSEDLAIYLQSEHSPLLKESPGPGKGH